MPPLRYHYRYFDFVIAAEMPLGELRLAEGGQIRYRVRSSRGELQKPAPEAWSWKWELPTGETFFLVRRSADGLLLRFPETLDASYRPVEGAVDLRPWPRVGVGTVRHLLLDHVLPRLEACRGHLVLHAAAVGDDRGAILLAGQGGAGKSTLAASFWAAGYEVLSDDCLLLGPRADGFEVIPSYPGLRLWPDSLAATAPLAQPDQGPQPAGRKARLPIVSGRLQRFRLRAMFVLRHAMESGAGDRLVVNQVRRSRACVELLKHTFMLDPSDHDVLERHFLMAGDVAEAVPLFELVYPRQFDGLSAVRRAVEEAAAGGTAAVSRSAKA